MIDHFPPSLKPYQTSSGAEDVFGVFFNDVSMFRKVFSISQGIMFGAVPFYYFVGGEMPTEMMICVSANLSSVLEEYLQSDDYVLISVQLSQAGYKVCF